MSKTGRYFEVIEAMRVALLGEVSPAMRAVYVTFDDTSVHFGVFVDGEPREIDLESAAIVDTELVAALPAADTITHAVLRADSHLPLPYPADAIVMFARREDG